MTMLEMIIQLLNQSIQFNQALSIDLISNFQCHRLITHVSMLPLPQKRSKTRKNSNCINQLSCYC